MNIKLTKKEKDFLIDWLSDDLDLAIKDKQDRAETYGKFVEFYIEYVSKYFLEINAQSSPLHLCNF